MTNSIILGDSQAVHYNWTKYTINKTKVVEPDNSDVAIRFGIMNKEFRLVEGDIEIPEKGLVVITGISGSGKSSCLRELCVAMQNPLGIQQINTQVFDNIETRLKDFLDDPHTLSAVGLGDIVTLLTPLKHLSDGQKYRLGIALLTKKDISILIIDEFCNQLDEISTIGILRLIKRLSKDRLVIVATSRPYGLEYVDCDKVYRIKQGMIHEWNVTKKNITDDITHFRGKRDDWDYFAQWHYRSQSAGMVNNIEIFKFKDFYEVGVIIGGQPYLNISTRNKMFPMYKNNTKMVNKDIYTVHRIVISPEFRGLGLSRFLFDTLYKTYYQPRGKMMVELLTALDDYIPFASNAGFSYGGELPPNPVRKVLQKLGFDFTRYLDDDYVIDFVKQHYEPVRKAVINSFNRGSSRKFDPDFEGVIYNARRMANVLTNYYYKRFDELQPEQDNLDLK